MICLLTGDNSSYSVWSGQNEQLADCGFWDFAEQKEFYATHQTFLSTNAVYLLVADTSKDLSKKTFHHMIEDEFECLGGILPIEVINKSEIPYTFQKNYKKSIKILY